MKTVVHTLALFDRLGEIGGKILTKGLIYGKRI